MAPVAEAAAEEEPLSGELVNILSQSRIEKSRFPLSYFLEGSYKIGSRSDISRYVYVLKN